MAKRPKILQWVPNDDPSKVSEPIDSKKDNGFIYKERMPFQYLNWLFNLIAKWFDFIDAENNQFGVIAEEVPSMSIVVLGGRKWDGVTYTEKDDQTLGPISAPATNPRIDRVVLNRSTLVASVVTGTEAASPAAPAIPANSLPLAQILIDPADTVIEQSAITPETSSYNDLATSSVVVSVITPSSDGNHTLTGEENAAEIRKFDLSLWSTKREMICDDENRKFTVNNPVGGQAAIVTTSAATPTTVDIPADGIDYEIRTEKGIGARPVDNTPVGSIVAVQDNIAGVSVPPKGWYIKLTAGEDGAGEYNEGLLTGESVSGSSPTITATAQISHSISPINGKTVHLINTEERFLRAGNSGVTQNSQNLSHNHTGNTSTDGSHSHRIPNGAGGSTNGAATDTSQSYSGSTEADGNHNHSLNINNDGGSESRPRNIGITYYLRIA